MSPEKKQPRFVLVLFGTLEYDGRVQRMIEILGSIGDVVVVDTAAQEDITKDFNVNRKPIELPEKLGAVARHLKFWLGVLREVAHLRPDAIVAEDYYSTFPGWLGAKFVGARLVYDAHELIVPEAGRPMGKRARFWYILERWSAPRADLIIAANPERARIMGEHYDLAETPEYMRNIPSSGEPLISVKEIVSRYPALSRRSGEDRIILYQGDVSLSRGLDRFVKALEYLPHHCRLVIAGTGPDLDDLRALAQPFSDQGRFVALGRIPNRLLSSITRLADVGVVAYPFEGLNNIYCAPNKLFEYAQAGLPVIATNQPPLKSLIENYGIGEVVDRELMPERLAEVMQRVIASTDVYRTRLRAFGDDYRWESEEARVRSRINGVLQQE